MRWRRSIRWINALLMIGTIGCRSSEVRYLGNAELTHYRDKMMQVEYPDVNEPTAAAVAYSQKPRTIRERAEDEIWEMSLMEAVHTALRNNKMLRTRTVTVAALGNPATSPSIYDPALGETGYLFGNRGVEAALADFDAQLSAATQWGSNTVQQNSIVGGVNNTGTGSFASSLSKTMANGGNITVNHSWNYTNTNLSYVPLPNNYVGTLQAVYTQPLWAAAGVEYNRIAAPPRSGLGSITGVSQGVAIARINTDQDIADFEFAVVQMIKDVEDLYWELYLAYRQFDALVANRNSMHRSWVEVKAKMDAGARGGSAPDEAQARENYFDARSQVENALSAVYVAENALRKQLGLPVNDGKMIRPKDDPVEAEFVVQWEPSVVDALTHRPELRRQKWQVKSLQLQYKAALNVANPTLNAVGAYQVNGFGTNLVDYQNAPLNSMYTSMANGNLNGWYAGLQFNVPIGLRTARMQVHNIELQLVKAKAALAAQELDITHELATAVQNIDAAYIVAQTVLDRKIAAVRRVEATQALYEVGAPNEQGLGVTLDLVLRAQAANAAAEIAYFTALINYNKAITEYNWRRGMLLEVDGIHLSEADWDERAKCDALKRAWERSFAIPTNTLHSEPEDYASPVPYPKTDLYNGLPAANEVYSSPDAAISPTEAVPPLEAAPREENSVPQPPTP